MPITIDFMIRPNRQPGRGHISALLVCLVGVTLCGTAVLPTTQTEPAASPASAPPVRLVGPLPAAKTLEEGLDYTEVERTLLEVVRDAKPGAPAAERPGSCLFLLLRRAKALPQLDAEQFGSLERPSFRNLLSEPSRYRGRAIRYAVRVNRVRKLAPGKGLPFSRWWRRSESIWQMDCIDGTGKYPGERPLRIYTHLDPTKLLGKAEKLADEWRYGKEGKLINVAAIFLKVFTAEVAKAEPPRPTERDYPCMVAWQIQRPSSGGYTAAPIPPLLVLMLVILILLAAAFWWVKRCSRIRREAEENARRALRVTGQEQNEPADEPEEGQQVDPMLKAAAEQYRKEHPDEQTDRPG